MLDLMIVEAMVRSNRHIVVTGASGWIGRATLDLLMRSLGEAFDTRVSCYGSSARTLDLGNGRHITQNSLSDLGALKARNIWVLHYAFHTKDRAEAMTERAYRQANQAIGDTVLDALDRIDVEAVFVASSGAANRAGDMTASPAMRLYGEMKRDEEVRLADWAETRERRAVIGRIFNITGPYINKHGAYAIASFISDALANRPIAVSAPREVIRSYVAIRELLSLVFALMACERAGVVRFDSGGDPLELQDVANVVASALGGGTVVRAAVTDPVPDRYVGDVETYSGLLKAHSIESVPLGQQVVETAPYIATPETTSLPTLNAGSNR